MSDVTNEERAAPKEVESAMPCNCHPSHKKDGRCSICDPCPGCGRYRATIDNLCDDCTMEKYGILFHWLIERTEKIKAECDAIQKATES